MIDCTMDDGFDIMVARRWGVRDRLFSPFLGWMSQVWCLRSSARDVFTVLF